MSKAPPARMASFETVATTSPVDSRPRTAGPAREAWWPTICAIRNEACSQLKTANRWRMIPAKAWIPPSRSRTSAQSTSARLSCSSIPPWIARPIVYGISAWATIQTIPKKIPAAIVASCCRPTQMSRRARRPRVGHARIVGGQADTARSSQRRGAFTATESLWSMGSSGTESRRDRRDSRVSS